MKALYITSVEPFSGKTAVCLALGKRLLSEGVSVGYLKPVSTQPWRTPDGRLADEDATFVRDILGLDTDSEDLSPVIITPQSLRERLAEAENGRLMERVKQSAQNAAQGKDVLLLEGGASLRQGYAIGLSNLQVAEILGAPALVIVSFRGEMNLVDDALTARFRLGDQLMGILINNVPEKAEEFVTQHALPFLARQGIEVIGVLPQVPRLSALSVGEIKTLLNAQLLTEVTNLEALAESIMVGAMTAEQALSRFRRTQNKAVITGGDRTDIQLAALETSTVALILTGNLHPSPLLIQQAESLRIPILLVKHSTMETVEKLERSAGKTRLGQQEKLETFTQLLAENARLDKIYQALGLS